MTQMNNYYVNNIPNLLMPFDSFVRVAQKLYEYDNINESVIH